MVPISNRVVIVIDTFFWLLQISPYQNVSTDFITNLLLANDSLFQKFIEIGNLRKAALLANSVLLSVSQETSMNFQERYKVLFKHNLLLKKWNNTSSLWSYPKSKEFTKSQTCQRKKKELRICIWKKNTIIKKINFWKTVEYNALNIRTYFLEKNVGLCVKYPILLHPKSHGFYVRCWLPIILAGWLCEQTISSTVVTSEERWRVLNEILNEYLPRLENEVWKFTSWAEITRHSFISAWTFSVFWCI